MKTAIVCEGGGMRGAYTSGVLQAFMDGGFLADALYGVSAGASNGVSYVSGQRERGMRTNVDYVRDKRYLSLESLFKTGSAFGMDFIFREIPQNLDPFDYDAFFASPCEFYAGVTDLETGRPVFYGREAIDEELAVLRASCSLPILSPIVAFRGHKYLDGGISAPIPLQPALEAGYPRIVVVLTRHKGYEKSPERFRPLYHAKYRAYPNFVRAMDLRHLVYNHTLARLSRLETEGRVLVVRPEQPLSIDRMTKDRGELMKAYHTGLEDGQGALERL